MAPVFVVFHDFDVDDGEDEVKEQKHRRNWYIRDFGRYTAQGDEAGWVWSMLRTLLECQLRYSRVAMPEHVQAVPDGLGKTCSAHDSFGYGD